jgi:hypothetical protein
MSAVGDFLFGDDDDTPAQIIGGSNPVQAPAEDPGVVKARQQAEARAAVERVTSLQRQLKTETENKSKDIYGAKSLLGNLGQVSQRLGAG